MAMIARSYIAAIAGGLAAALGSAAALSHPHVWVATQSHAIFENGALTGLRYTWMFDEMYTTSAIDGLDKNNDGKLDAAELDELIKVNIEGLKEFEYFTTVTMAGKPVQFADPKDFSMEILAVDEPPGPQLVAAPSASADQQPPATQEKRGLWSRLTGWISGLFGGSDKPGTTATVADAAKPAPQSEKSKVLALRMTLPLKAPVAVADLKDAKQGFQFLLNDGQMYIWFEPTAKDGIGVAPGAPSGCRAIFVAQEMDEQQKKLQEAFGRVGGLAVGGPGKAVAIVCDKP